MKKLWLAFVAVLVVSFSILGWVGTRIYQEAPPIPERVPGDTFFALGAVALVVFVFGLSRQRRALAPTTPGQPASE